MRHRDCSINMPSDLDGFLTSNLPLEKYLKMYSECDGIRHESRKCSIKICPIGGEATKVKKPKIEKSKENWPNWVSSLMMYQKITENVDYKISVDGVAKFININWSNQLRNPLSDEFKV